MIRFGIIGCGAISAAHAAAIQKIADAKFVACCDIDEVKGKHFAVANTCHYYHDYQALLADPAVDVVTIATPHDLHAPMSIAALKAGKHVVCEKPMAINAASAKQVSKVAAQSDRVYVVCYQNRFNPSMVRLKQLLQAKTFGALEAMTCRLNWHRDAAYYSLAAWKGTWAHEGGGVLINQAIHTLDAVCWLAAKPLRIKGKIMTTLLTDTIEVEDMAMAVAVLPGEIPVVISASNDYALNPDPVIEMVFETAQVSLSASQLVVNGEVQALPKLKAAVGKAYWGTGHERLLRAVIHRIQGVPDELDDHLASLDANDSLAMVLGIYQSNATGEWQSLA